jgi:hypothetical protein
MQETGMTPRPVMADDMRWSAVGDAASTEPAVKIDTQLPHRAPRVRQDSARSPSGPRQKKSKEEKPKQGAALAFEDPEPWHEAIDGAALLDALRQKFRAYVVLPNHADTALALWVLLAYTFDSFQVAPKLAITSPVKRCGKTQLLILLSALTPRALPTSNITASALFRIIQKFQPTLLIDEADTFINRDEDLRGIANSSHTRRTAIVIRNVGDDHEPRAFSTWCPQAIALIGKLSDTIADRSIHIQQRRRTRTENVQRLRQDRIDTECLALRRQAARWAADVEHLLREADPEVPDGLNDRAQDCWRPLLAIADRAGGDWPEAARTAAKELSHVSAGADERSVELLTDIQAIFKAAGDPEALPTSSLLDALIKSDDGPWATWRKDENPITAHGLAQLLKRFGVPRAGTMRFKKDETPEESYTAKGYRRDAFADAFLRYLPDQSVTGNKLNETGPEVAKNDPSHNETVTDAKTPNSIDKHCDCYPSTIASQENGKHEGPDDLF